MSGRIESILIIICFLGLWTSVGADVLPPYLGTIKQTEAHLLYSPGKVVKKLTLTLYDKTNKETHAFSASSEQENDFVAKFHMKNLKPGELYRYAISETDSKKVLIKGDEYYFKTLSTDFRKSKVKLAFVACVNSLKLDPDPT